MYCKSHCHQINKDFQKRTGDSVTALFYTCQVLDVPFVSRVVDIVMKTKERKIQERSEEINKQTGKLKYSSKEMKAYIEDYKDFGFYYDVLRKTKNGGLDWTSFYSGTDVDFKDFNENIQEKKDLANAVDEYMMNWGSQEETDDYIFLDNTFAKYTKGIEFVNAQQEDLYRDLCRDRLLLRKINDGRYKGDESIDNIQKRIDRTMTTLKVNNFETSKPKTLSEQLIFEKIKQIEQTKPADLYKEPRKYKDFNKLKQYMERLVLRPLLNSLVGLKDYDIDIDDIDKYNLEVEEEGGEEE